MEELSLLHKKRVRDDSAEFEFEFEFDSDSAEVKRLREDLLFSLEDSNSNSNPDQEVQEGLFSVMKSFEEEIFAPAGDLAAVVDLTSESGESKPDLGYLLGASDDELGLPPPTATTHGAEEIGGGKEETELARVDSGESAGIGELWGVEGELPNYDAFELGEYGAGEYGHVAYGDGLFEYSNVVYDGSECSDFSWRLGTMPAQ